MTSCNTDQITLIFFYLSKVNQLRPNSHYNRGLICSGMIILIFQSLIIRIGPCCHNAQSVFFFCLFLHFLKCICRRTVSMSHNDTDSCSGKLSKNTAQQILKQSLFHPVGTALHLLGIIGIQCTLCIDIHSIKYSSTIIK